ncbi:MAG: hypothetical protein MJY82_10690 [Fibrobacter sp.]|nr:hypothetical protein [Fibrobacter sp.]
MKKNLPGVLFLIAMPLSVVLYVKVEAWSGSEILGLLAAVLLYVAVGAVIALLFGMSPLPPADQTGTTNDQIGSTNDQTEKHEDSQK